MSNLNEIRFTYDPFSGVYSIVIDDHDGLVHRRTGRIDSHSLRCHISERVTPFMEELNTYFERLKEAPKAPAPKTGLLRRILGG